MPNMFWPTVYSIPLLIVYLLAAVLGFINLQKHKPAARIAMFGGMIAGLACVSSLVVQLVLWTNMTGWTLETLVAASNFVGIGARVVEAAGMAMTVFAVYAGRRPAARTDDRDDEEPRE